MKKFFPHNFSEKDTYQEKYTYAEAFKIFSEKKLFECESSNQDLFQLIVNLAYYFPNHCQLLAALFQLSGVIFPIKLYAETSSYLKEQLNALQSGQLIAAHCLTEKVAGTDSFAMETTITPHKDVWILEGNKSFICNATIADLGLIYAKKTTLEPTFYDFSALLIPMKNKNITVSSPYAKLGLADIDMADIFFHQVSCEKEMLVGKPNEGFGILQISTTYERILIPLAFIGRMIKIHDICHAECRGNSAACYALSDMFIKIKVSIAFALDELKKINFGKWQRSYLVKGCMMKIYLTEAYLETITCAIHLFPYLSTETKKIILDEKKSALAAWVYSGTNDSLKQMLGKLYEYT